MEVKFSPGRVFVTPGVIQKIPRNEMNDALDRHLHCDWGDVPKEDKRYNELSLKKGARLVSAYHASDSTKFWIITEADRSATTVLLPSEY